MPMKPLDMRPRRTRKLSMSPPMMADALLVAQGLLADNSMDRDVRLVAYALLFYHQERPTTLP